jgi:hypothetical protein
MTVFLQILRMYCEAGEVKFSRKAFLDLGFLLESVVKNCNSGLRKAQLNRTDTYSSADDDADVGVAVCWACAEVFRKQETSFSYSYFFFFLQGEQIELHAVCFLFGAPSWLACPGRGLERRGAASVAVERACWGREGLLQSPQIGPHCRKHRVLLVCRGTHLAETAFFNRFRGFFKTKNEKKTIIFYTFLKTS